MTVLLSESNEIGCDVIDIHKDLVPLTPFERKEFQKRQSSKKKNARTISPNNSPHNVRTDKIK